jgi:ADP-ribose pyrophosphatase YjhB (NUDIX family)
MVLHHQRAESSNLFISVRGLAQRMVSAAQAFDYDGALVVVETDADTIVFIHPPGGPPEAPASLPSNPCHPGDMPTDAAVRMVREMTGLDVTLVREYVTERPAARCSPTPTSLVSPAAR